MLVVQLVYSRFLQPADRHLRLTGWLARKMDLIHTLTLSAPCASSVVLVRPVLHLSLKLGAFVNL